MIRRAVLLTTPTLHPDKQEGALLRWATEHRYVVTSVTAVPAAAQALALDGIVEVIVVVSLDRTTYDMADNVTAAGGTVDVLRPRARPGDVHHITRTHQLILDATKRGVDADTIAAVLDIPITTVQAALSTQGKPTVITGSAHTPGRRAQEVTRPAGRR